MILGHSNEVKSNKNDVSNNVLKFLSTTTIHIIVLYLSSNTSISITIWPYHTAWIDTSNDNINNSNTSNHELIEMIMN